MPNSPKCIVKHLYHNGSISEHERDKLLKALEQEPKTDVLDKIRAEIERQEKWLLQAGYNQYNVDIAFSTIKSLLAESEDKYGRYRISN